MDIMKRSPPAAANLVPEVAVSGGLLCRSSSFSDIKPARQLNSASSFIQMLLLALRRLRDTLRACVKSSMVPSYVSVAVRILCSSASPSVRESECVSGKPYSQSPVATTVSWKSSRRSTELTENESKRQSQHHSDADSYGKKPSPTWVVSSAASLHATGDRALLSGLVTNKHGDTDTFVHAVDEVPMPVVAHGSAVSDEVELPNVCLVPGLTANLVSICQLVAMGYSVEFGRGMCYIRNSSDGTIVGKAQLRKGGQYVLDFLKVPIGVASSTSLIDMVTDE